MEKYIKHFKTYCWYLPRVGTNSYNSIVVLIKSRYFKNTCKKSLNQNFKFIQYKYRKPSFSAPWDIVCLNIVVSPFKCSHFYLTSSSLSIEIKMRHLMTHTGVTRMSIHNIPAADTTWETEWRVYGVF